MKLQSNKKRGAVGSVADKNQILRSVVFCWGLAFLLTDGLAAEPAQRRPYYYSQLGKRPPELRSSDAHWINAARKVTLSQLKGQVVWLQFNF